MMRSLPTAILALAMGAHALSAQALPDTLGQSVAWRVNARDTTGVIAGIVFTTDGNPFPNAMVWIPGTGFGASTDVNGRFSFKPPQAGKWPLEAMAIGFRSAKDTVFVGDGASVFVTVTMLEMDFHACGLVVCAGGPGGAGCKDLNVVVLDSLTGLPVQGLITLRAESGDTVLENTYRQTTTDPHAGGIGTGEAIRLRGRYTITISARGYQPWSKSDVELLLPIGCHPVLRNRDHVAKMVRRDR